MRLFLLLRAHTWQGAFSRYALVGVVNTSIHWGVFFGLYASGFSQGASNCLAFFVAVTVSYLLNSAYTFRAKLSSQYYLRFLAFMSVLLYALGRLADSLHTSPLITLVISSLISLVLGFIYSRRFVFVELKQLKK